MINCETCKPNPIHPDKKCCFNCGVNANRCQVWHHCGEDCPEWRVEGKSIEQIIQDANTNFLYAAIDKQFANCIVNDRYKAGIFTSNSSNLEIVSDMLKAMSLVFEEYLADVIAVKTSKDGTEIRFKNGSYIISRKINEGQRGRRFNEVIYDSTINKELVNCVIYPTFVPYHQGDRHLLKMIGVEF